MNALKRYLEVRVVKTIEMLVMGLSILLSGCISTTTVPNLDLPNPPELKMRDVKWEVYNLSDEARM